VSDLASKKRYLLVEPDFPIPPKSRNHKDFLPIGLLKLGTWLQKNKHDVQIVRGNVGPESLEFEPQEVWITSLFTYWSEYVRNSAKHYRKVAPKAKIVVGGIYASLMPEHCKDFTQCDEVFVGVHSEAEKVIPDYGLLPTNPHPVDFQIIHASRGCFRKCEFCGTWKIEPEYTSKSSITPEIKAQKLVFYDNNFLHNPNIEDILNELTELRKQRKLTWCEAQSGFDGRVLIDKPHLGEMLKQAGFRYPRIAWDWGFDERQRIRQQLEVLFDAGYAPKDVHVFLLYNWDIQYHEMEKKRIKCYRWGVQISDCRYRPLNQPFDNFITRRSNQTSLDYYIHDSAGWSDELIKQFRRNVRMQNICIRHGFPFYSRDYERKLVDKRHTAELKSLHTLKEKEAYLKSNDIHYWFPGRITYP
jgi:hypothetical protein